MLRIVSLSQWIAESGLFDQTLAEYAIAQRTGGDTSAVVQDLAAMMVKGHSVAMSQGGRQALDKAALDQLHRMSRSRQLPLEDVHEDLKIWHLTLLRRPSRKKISLGYGRVTKRPNEEYDIDPELLAQMKQDGEFGPQGSRQGLPRLGGTGRDSGLSNDAGGWSGQGRGSVGGGDGYGGLGPDGQPIAFDWSGPGGGPVGADGRPIGGGPGGAGAPGEAEIGPDGKPILLDADGKPILLDADGKPIGGNGAEPGDEGQTDGKTEDGSRPDSGGGVDGEAGDQSGKSAGARAAAGRASVKPGQTAADKAKTKRELGDLGEEFGSGEDDEQTEEQRLLASGALFRIKKRIAEEVILDEFANMLLPPPPLTALGGDTDDQSDAEDDGDSPRQRKVKANAPSSAAMGAGVRSNLAEDFRKCVLGAFQLIDFPDEVKIQMSSEAEVQAFLRDDTDEDPVMRNMLSRSNTIQQREHGESSLLETHLRMRAEKRGRRLQLQGERSCKANLHGSQDCWSRRLKGCNQALRSISALDTFAMMRKSGAFAMTA